MGVRSWNRGTIRKRMLGREGAYGWRPPVVARHSRTLRKTRGADSNDSPRVGLLNPCSQARLESHLFLFFPPILTNILPQPCVHFVYTFSRTREESKLKVIEYGVGL